MTVDRSVTTAPPAGATAPTTEDPGPSLLASAIELQTLARGRDPFDGAAPAGPEPLSTALTFGFALSALLAVALVVELLPA